MWFFLTTKVDGEKTPSLMHKALVLHTPLVIYNVNLNPDTGDTKPGEVPGEARGCSPEAAEASGGSEAEARQGGAGEAPAIQGGPGEAEALQGGAEALPAQGGEEELQASGPGAGLRGAPGLGANQGSARGGQHHQEIQAPAGSTGQDP